MTTRTGTKIPLVLISCGSFNPVTNAHMRMFELARDFFKKSSSNSRAYNVVSGIVSPVSDGYNKKGLLCAHHRTQMLQLATASVNWITLSGWECGQAEWSPTLSVLEHHRQVVQEQYGPETQLMFLCGGDLIESFNVPNLWKDEDIEEICSKFGGLAVIRRNGSDPEKIIYENDLLYKHRHNIHLITDHIANEISSTRIRRAVSRNESVKYLINDDVGDYIQKENLYKNA